MFRISTRSQKIILQFSFALFCFSMSYAQSQIIEWQHLYGSTDWDNEGDLVQATDGGYYFVGATRTNSGDVTGNNGGFDYWVVKLNASGAMEWERSLGGSQFDYPYGITATYYGGCLAVGSARSNDGDVSSNNGNVDAWVVKLNASGSIVWEKSYGGSQYDGALVVRETDDLGFILAASSNSNDLDVTGNNGFSDFWVVKLDTDGNLEWQKSLGSSQSESPSDILQTSLGGYIIVGTVGQADGDISAVIGESDYWVVMLDMFGTLIWERTYGGTRQDHAQSIVETSDGGFVIGGYTLSRDGDVSEYFDGIDGWLVKINSQGNIMWDKTLGNDQWNKIFHVNQFPDGRIVAAGETYNFPTINHEDMWLLTLDSNGEILHDKILGGSGEERFGSIDITDDGGLVLFGTTQSDDHDVVGDPNLLDYWAVKIGSTLSLTAMDVSTNKKVIKTVNVLGQEIVPSTDETYIEIYSDGTTRKVHRTN